ncbi:hypothetical protein [Gorillibacterium sp. sgz5001074]|uniref:hypothetical protein n=1 Tax=Gorillibacterium sp. sgz5001074 TaxID=3446695 RepID=UPI003F674884
MEEGDPGANYAYYALHELNILPHDLERMGRREKAAIYAMIDVRVKKEQAQRQKG